MSAILIDTQPMECKGVGDCTGGKSPDPPIDAYPLLCWSPGHPTHGHEVFTEDGRASICDVAAASATGANYDAIASRFGTTVAHVRQALGYAFEASCAGKGG